MVNGMASSPAASSVARRRSGVLSGAWRWQSRSPLSDSSIIPWLAETGTQRGQLVAARGAGVGVGQQAGLVEHQPAHRHEVVDGGGVAVVAQPVAGDGVAQLGSLAEREQRLVAAGAGAGPGDAQARPVGRGTAWRRGPVTRRTCSSRSGRGTAWSAG